MFRHRCVDGEDDPHWRVKKNIVPASLARSGCRIRTIYAEGRIIPPTEVIDACCAIRWHWLREGRKRSRRVSVVLLQYRITESLLCFTGEQINTPRLGVEVARCGSRRFDDFHE